MIVDASAILAVVLREADAGRFLDAMLSGERPRMSVANWFEATMVVDGRRDPVASSEFDDVMRLAEIGLEQVTLEQAAAARLAWRNFGRGQHPARLNFGDCFAYALAKCSGEPLLFKGDDFSQTDIEPALKG